MKCQNGEKNIYNGHRHGVHAQLHPDIVRRMQEKGHITGNHTYSHIHLTKSNRERELNMLPVLWTADPLDGCSSNAACITEKIVDKAEEGYIFVTMEEILFD